MFVVVWGWLARSWTRSLVVGVGILVAVSGFTVMTSATRTSTLMATGTVAADYRGQYDLLVRAPGAVKPAETQTGMVRPDFLSSVSGGISVGQWKTIAALPGVGVAAPMANLGTVIPYALTGIDLGTITPGVARVWRVSMTWSTDRGLSTIKADDSYVYYTPNPLTYDANNFSMSGMLDHQERDPSGTVYQDCPGDDNLTGSGGHVSGGDALTCLSTSSARVSEQKYVAVHGDRLMFYFEWPMPMNLAAIDPRSESELDGLGAAIDSGRDLTAADTPKMLPPAAGYTAAIPAVMSSTIFQDLDLTATAQAMPAAAVGIVRNSSQLNDVMAALAPLPAQAPTFSTRMTTAQVYAGLVRNGVDRAYTGTPAHQKAVPLDGLAQVGAVSYRPQPVGAALVPEATKNSSQSYQLFPGDDDNFLPVPPTTGRGDFRTVSSSNLGVPEPYADVVGSFDPTRLTGFTSAVSSPLNSFVTPQLAAADAASAAALGGRSLLPDGDPGGYIQAPPLLLTPLSALTAFPTSATPLSTVRVRVTGAVGLDALSRARVRQVAQEIEQATGLQVDVVDGASAVPVTIALPAGEHGRPALMVTEVWSKKGVALVLKALIDRKSVVLFLLVLIVCVLFVGAASAAAVRTRGTQLAVLRSFGWTSPRVFGAVLGELGTLGALAGIVGAAIAPTLGRMAGTSVSWGHAWLAVPAGLAVAVIAGAIPAVRAASVSPIQALRSGVRPPRARRSSRPVGSIRALAWGSVIRTPARTGLAILGLTVGTAAATIVLAVMSAFHGMVVGSVLGSAVAVKVRGVDEAAVVLVMILALATIADLQYSSQRERASQFAVIRAAGWTQARLTRWIAWEGVFVGIPGAALGIGAGLAAVRAFAGTLPPAAYQVAGPVAAIAVIAAALCAAATLAVSTHGPLAPVLTEE